jgi:hypothetical protein
MGYVHPVEIILVENPFTGGDPDQSRSFSDRLGGIGHKVEQDLANLRDINRNHRHRLAWFDLQDDARGYRCPQQVNGVRYQRANIDPFDLETSLPGVGKHLIGKIGCPPRGDDDVLNLVASSCIGRHDGQGQIGVAEDPHQEVVEIVSNSAGKDAETFHFSKEMFALFGGHGFRHGLLVVAISH